MAMMVVEHEAAADGAAADDFLVFYFVNQRLGVGGTF